MQYNLKMYYNQYLTDGSIFLFWLHILYSKWDKFQYFLLNYVIMGILYLPHCLLQYYYYERFTVQPSIDDPLANPASDWIYQVLKSV